jgi:2-dehydro-3-deoxyphosphooctonate aldolase (KDO 8-P synthase)
MTPNSIVTVGPAPHRIEIGNARKLSIIAGPCQLESRAHAFDMAGALKEACAKLGVGLIYKTSFDKANRTSAATARGIGLEKALPIFADIRQNFGLPVLTDVHERDQCAPVAQAVDILQIPAFLSRQTDLLVAAAHTGKVVNVKKGQFLAPWDMKNVIAKITSAPILAGFGAPVVFDATHSVQQPGGMGASSGGDRQMVPYLARAAVAVGVATVFMEVHQDPDHAPSDGPNMVKLKDFPALLEQLVAIDTIAKRNA